MRESWRAEVTALSAIDLVFLDETGSHLGYTPTHAWSPRGQRAHAAAPRNPGENKTVIAALTRDGVGALMRFDGGMTSARFAGYVRHVLAPTLRAGQVVIADNLRAHYADDARATIEAQGARLVYLPPYSPDFNPIEEAFAKIKGILRKAEARSREALIEAIAQAISVVSARDARGFFEHCGYRAMVQLF